MLSSDREKKHGGSLQLSPKQTAAFFVLTISAGE
jgi:hypothetical protein